jgi:tetratricopeptide (TPR) repeat protein
MRRIRISCVVVFLLPSLVLADDFDRGKEALDKGEYDLAIACFNAYIRENPKEVAAYYNRGLAYAHKNEHDKAIDDFTQVIRLNPNIAPAYDSGFLSLNSSVATIPFPSAWPPGPNQSTLSKRPSARRSSSSDRTCD